MARAHLNRVVSSLPGRIWRGVVLLTAMIAMGLATPPVVASITLNNPGFETTGTGIPGWTVTDGTTGITSYGDGVFTSNNFAGGYEGTHAGFFYWGGGTPGNSYNDHPTGTFTAAQIITGTPATPHTQYILQVDIGYRDDLADYDHTLPLPDDIEIKVLAGATELASPVRVSPSPIYRNFVTYSVTYTTGDTVPSGDLQVEIIGTRLATTGSNVPSPSSTYNPLSHIVEEEAFMPFDNVVLETPEPSSLAALAVGIVLPLARRRRNSK